MSEKGAAAGPVRMPIRQASASSDTAVQTSDPNDASTLLAERLQAWKHAVRNLEEYVGVTEKLHKIQAKEYEKVFKAIQNPLREGHHFDPGVGGLAAMFETMRTNTQGLTNSHLEAEKNLKTSVLPIFDRLVKEIKAKAKELQTGAIKNAKEVEKARHTTQKHIELLGQQTASHDSAGGRMEPLSDPYVVHRGIHYRLNKQVMEENNHKNDLIIVQNSFVQFEAHILEVIQQAMVFFNEFVTGQSQKAQLLYAEMVGSGQQISPNFEWQKFTERNGNMLVHPETPDRSVDDVDFPNQNHHSTKPVLEGRLERKSRNKLSLSGFTAGHYVVTPSKFLHEFKDTDNYRRDPTPDMSLYLPDAVIGITNGDKFNIKGRDVSGGFGSKLSGNSEIHFKAPTADDAVKWFEVIRSVIGSGPEKRVVSGESSQAPPYEDEEVIVPKSLDANPRPPSPTLGFKGGPKSNAA